MWCWSTRLLNRRIPNKECSITKWKNHMIQCPALG